MHHLFLRILSCLLVLLGIFALLMGIRILRRTLGTKIAFEAPAGQQTRTFSLMVAATYAVWQKGIFFGRDPDTQVQLTIRHEKTGERLPLTPSPGRIRVNTGSHSRVLLYSFFAAPGNYTLEAVESGMQAGTVSVASRLLSKKRTGSRDTSIQIRDYQPGYHVVFGILLLLIGFFAVIGGVVFVTLSFTGQV